MAERNFALRNAHIVDCINRDGVQKYRYSELDKPLSALLQLKLFRRDKSLSALDETDPIFISVRVDSGTDYTMVPKLKLAQAGYVDKLKDVSATINPGKASEFETVLFRCTLEIMVSGNSAKPYRAIIDTLVARNGDLPPQETRKGWWDRILGWFRRRSQPGPAAGSSYDYPSSTDHRKLDEDEPEIEGVISLADLMKCFEVHFVCSPSSPSGVAMVLERLATDRT